MIVHFLHRGPPKARTCLCPALSQTWVLSTTWTDCPTNVTEEIAHLWATLKIKDGCYYFAWTKDGLTSYPVIAKFLEDRGVDDCLIHHWKV